MSQEKEAERKDLASTERMALGPTCLKGCVWVLQHLNQSITQQAGAGAGSLGELQYKIY